jgi:hypothetical protein
MIEASTVRSHQLGFKVSGFRCQDYEPDENYHIEYDFFFLKPET